MDLFGILITAGKVDDVMLVVLILTNFLFFAVQLREATQR